MTPTAEFFLNRLRADSARIAEVARAGTDAPVPSCPGWTVADLLEHVAHVFLHKVEVLRRNARPDPWPPDDLLDRDPRELYEEAAAAIVRELAGRDPGAPAWTWQPDDQTTGFWFRRMAHEAAVHRVDAELAHDALTPVDPDLAVDGIDEVLRVFLGNAWWQEHSELPLDGTIRISAADRSWVVAFAGTDLTISAESTDGAGAEVTGEADPVLLWLWGRQGDDAVRIDGDLTLVAGFRRRLAEATG